MKTITLIFTLLLLSSACTTGILAKTTSMQPLADPNLEILNMIDQITNPLVFSYHDHLMSYGARYTGSENCSQAAIYLLSAFTQMGLQAEFHEWSFGGFTSQNVVATLPGNNPTSTSVIIMSAHYDCTPGSLGADDDGSGVAGVLATAAVLSNYTFNHTIKFVCFSGEEVGTYGSFMYAKDAYDTQENIHAVINLDMIGYANSTHGGNYINFMCPPRGRWIGDYAQTLGELYYPYTNLSVEIRPNYIGADHQAFIEYGYDGVWIAHHDGYPWANTPDDTPDHLNWTYQVKATKFLLAVVAELANKPIPISVQLTTPYEGYAYFYNKPLFPLLLKNGWYKGTRGATIALGRPIVSATVNTEQEIEYVVFCIDGNFMSWETEPPFEWRIQGKHFPPIGKHTINVYAQTKNGCTAYDEMDITLYTLSSQYGKAGNLIEKFFLSKN